MEVSIQVLIIVVLFIFNAIFVLTEFALASVRNRQLSDMEESGNSRASAVLSMLASADRAILGSQLGITMTSIALGWAGIPFLAELIDPLITSLVGDSLSTVSRYALAAAIGFLIITVAHVIFAELIPKSIALQTPERSVTTVIYPVRFFLTLMRPLVVLIYGSARWLMRLIGIDPALGSGRIYTEDELRTIVEMSRRGGEIFETEEEIIRRAFVFHDYTAENIMVPRTEVDALPIDASIDDIYTLMSEHNHGRYPVYKQGLDDIQGMLYVKELIPAIGRAENNHIDIASLIRPALNVPNSMPIDRLLEEMKDRGTHVAIVVDEYGGTAGMVTLDDILERVLGEVPDEFEQPAPDIVEEPDGWARVNGLTLINDINDHFGMELQSDESNTIGGLVFAELGQRPQVGDTVILDRFAIRVEALDGLRIAQLRFIPTESPDELNGSDEPDSDTGESS